ncbi:MAG: acyl-CoA dehydrogenase family protein [Gammaproteobacteria bacterium]|nr:acyl-CoA dehydrogenase family protein [Gammaproteobacteria bacterium]MBQ0838305.1 acyl-CoA dehydrogenase family protein [Gammaproteobacteria bacterium]
MSNEEETLILDSINRWLERDVAPYAHDLEQADEYPHAMVEQMKELGLFGATIDPEYGGLGLSASTYSKIVAAVAEVWMSLSGIFNSHLIMARCVQSYGTNAQKQKYLPRFASGELRGGIGLTEPDAGTDLQGIRCAAVKDGDYYVVNGSKAWITNSIEGSVIGLLVKTDTNATPPRKGMSMFIAENGEGFNVSKKLKKLGYKGIDTADISFDNYRVHKDCLIGGVEGRGFYNAVGGLELGRINVAARGVGVATAALKQATAYAQQRKTFGKPICEHQAIQLKLGEMATRTEAARLLLEQAAKAFDSGERCDMEAGMAKYFATEAAAKNADENLRIHGAFGYSCEADVERLYRDAPLMIIGEGTNEMQRIIIARQLIERNPI